MEPKCTMYYCDCYHENTCYCWRCKRNENATGELENNYISTVNKMTELLEYLMDVRIPDGVIVASRPKLSLNKAWSLIWFLQEITGCLPDNIEMCDKCDGLYDSNQEGCHIDDQYAVDGKVVPKKYWGFHCDNCVPDIEYYVR